MKKIYSVIGFCLFYCLIGNPKSQGQIPPGSYLGQNPPGEVPEVFASGIIPAITPSIVFTSDGLECFYTYFPPTAIFLLMTANGYSGDWTDFDTASFSVGYDQSPFLSPDDSRLFFISQRPVPGMPFLGLHVWFTDRLSTSWSDPVPLDSPVRDYQIIKASVAANGNLYLSVVDNDSIEIHVSKLVNGFYQELVKMSDSIHYLPRPMRPYIAPDESYMLFDASETQDPFSQRDLFITHRKPDGTWTKAAPLSNAINTETDETTPHVSGDGQYLFFNRDGVTYWMLADNVVSVKGEHALLQSEAQLFQNAPDPCRDITAIRYFLPRQGHVKILVRNLLGNVAALPVDEEKPAGNHEIYFNTAELTGGIYFYTLYYEKSRITRKMIIQK